MIQHQRRKSLPYKLNHGGKGRNFEIHVEIFLSIRNEGYFGRHLTLPSAQERNKHTKSLFGYSVAWSSSHIPQKKKKKVV